MLLLKRIILPVLFITVLISEGCDKGIEPRPADEVPGFSGRITFIGAWPDSIKRTFIVVFDSLLEEPADFNLYNLKFISDSIPTGVNFYDYDSRMSPILPIGAGDYAYLAVVQQSTTSISLNRQDWIVAGVFYAYGDTTHPGQLIIPDKTFIKNINIWCDFNNPPPQPPGG
jgi:hypothetical protein